MTSAAALKAALEAQIGADWTVEYHTSSTTGDGAGNNGSGVITTTALKLSLQYSIAYGNFHSFQFNMDDLLSAMSADQAAVVQAVLAGVGSLVDVEGTSRFERHGSRRFADRFWYRR